MTRDTSTYDIGRWARPPVPWPADSERWAAFCTGIVMRIEQVRTLGEFAVVQPDPVPVPAVSSPVDHACEVDWLFDMPADGPSLDAWVARIRAEIGVAIPERLSA